MDMLSMDEVNKINQQVKQGYRREEGKDSNVQEPSEPYSKYFGEETEIQKKHKHENSVTDNYTVQGRCCCVWSRKVTVDRVGNVEIWDVKLRLLVFSQ